MVSQFKGNFAFLSNFQHLSFPIIDGNIGYYSVEHYYVAMKTLDEETRLKVSTHPFEGLKAFGRTIELRPDWEDIKLDVMEWGLRQKFKNNYMLRRKLIKTGDEYLQEGNFWKDKYWGVCLRTGNGKNHLGKLLMKIRGELIAGGKL